MQTISLSDALGVELTDFDIKQPCRAEEQAALRRLFCEHHLLLVRGQQVTAEDQRRFVSFFGPVRERGDDNAGAFVTNRGGRPAGAGTGKQPGRLLWHSDGVYGPRPGIATSLLAQDVRPESVPTMFASGARAYERLPVAMRDRVDMLHALFLRDLLVERTDVRLREEHIPAAEPERFTKYVHPVVWQLPHADQKVLLINELATSHIVELPRDQSEALLHELFSRHVRRRQRLHPQVGERGPHYLGQPGSPAFEARHGRRASSLAPSIPRWLVHRRRAAGVGGDGVRAGQNGRMRNQDLLSPGEQEFEAALEAERCLRDDHGGCGRPARRLLL